MTTYPTYPEGSRLAGPVSRKAKVAIGFAAAGITGLVTFLIARSANAAPKDEFEIVKLRKDAAASANAARTAQAAAQAAAGREAAARGVAAQANADRAAAEAYAARAGQEATAAVAAAQAASAQATGLATAARNEANAARRATLERESALRAQMAQQLAQQATAAQATAAQATQVAQVQAQKATAATTVAAQAAETKQTAIESVDTHVQAANTATTQANTAAVQAVQANASLEMKRALVADAFQQVLADVKRRNPSITQQAAINTAAAHLRAQGIVLDAPNLAVSFWQLPDADFTTKVTNAVNAYLEKPMATPVKAPAKAPTAIKATAKVTTKIDPAKLKAVQDAYSAAIAYAIDRNASAAQKSITPQIAYAMIVNAFRTASVLRPGGPAVPVPAQLDNVDTEEAVQFWMQPLATLKTAMTNALAAAKRAVESNLEVLALAPNNTYVTVKPSALARNAAGAVITRKDPKTGKMLPTINATKLSGGAFGLSRPSAYGW